MKIPVPTIIQIKLAGRLYHRLDLGIFSRILPLHMFRRLLDGTLRCRNGSGGLRLQFGQGIEIWIIQVNSWNKRS